VFSVNDPAKWLQDGDRKNACSSFSEVPLWKNYDMLQVSYEMHLFRPAQAEQFLTSSAKTEGEQAFNRAQGDIITGGNRDVL
jgi:hypothetical protein